ncbi:LUD domain-containing protein [Solwaraspora sp. WMMD791]|uniref:LutC/YkgG family protein n=1 Tax=Solwaraspora sp. WMMD791 TaxID=3016086 RepID=UPI00249A0991|nr:LUD domain-containing protein [Solwaraspora sp. WMMD791]WFE27124.1 LUD domain-containing protein [Solwaraspora sp. WMMD791]
MSGDDPRGVILARLRAAREHRAAPTAVPPVPPVPPAAAVPRPPRDTPAVDPVTLFSERVRDYRATVHHCTDADLADRLGDVLDGVPLIVVPADLPAAWLAGCRATVLRDGTPAPLSVTDLDAPGLAAVTGCAVAIAETGTVVLDTGPAQGPRRLTLVPDHHVCVVRAEQVAPDVPQALARLADPTRPVTMISGPSATSDIELNRVEGVHGPRRLDVLLVRPVG